MDYKCPLCFLFNKKNYKPEPFWENVVKTFHYDENASHTTLQASILYGVVSSSDHKLIRLFPNNKLELLYAIPTKSFSS